MIVKDAFNTENEIVCGALAKNNCDKQKLFEDKGSSTTSEIIQ